MTIPAYGKDGIVSLFPKISLAETFLSLLYKCDTDRKVYYLPAGDSTEKV